MPRVVIVGAGISGLTLAFRLQQGLPQADLCVLECASRLGGTIDSLSRDGFVVEAGPNGILDNNPCTLDLVRAVGLENRLVPASDAARRNRFLYLDGRLRMLPTGPGSFLTTDLLSWIAKLRLLTERFRPPRRVTTDESIDAFARRRVGVEIARTFADAFVTGILAGDPTLLSIQATFPRMATFEREHGSVMKGMAAARRERRARGEASAPMRMWSFAGGLGTLIRGLAERLKTPPLCDREVTRVRRTDSGWRVEVAGQTPFEADAVVLACPAYRQAEILGGVDPELGNLIGGIDYNRVAVVSLGFRRENVPHSLEGFGYLAPQRLRGDVLGVQWCSSIYPDRAPAGRVLVRAMCGGWNRREIVDWDDDRLISAVRAELARSIGVRVAPVFRNIVRWNRAIPQYVVGHLDRVGQIERQLERHPGLFVGGNAYRGVAINDCVEQAGRLGERVASFLRQR